MTNICEIFTRIINILFTYFIKKCFDFICSTISSYWQKFSNKDSGTIKLLLLKLSLEIIKLLLKCK